MKKLFFNHYWILALWLLAFVQTACTDDEGGQPVILSVTTTDPASEAFTEAERGQMIVIVGEHLDGAKAVYINDQEVYLNPVYNTASHIIVTIPADLVLCAEDASLRGEIRVQTGHGEATYTFHILAPECWITEYRVERTEQADGTLAAQPGTPITIYGKNFYDITRLWLSENESGTGGETYEMTGISVNKTFDEISATLPSSLPEEGYIFVECRSNTTSSTWARSAYSAPLIASISSDMPIPGTEVTITGSNFAKLTGVDICGDYMISAADLTVENGSTEDRITFVLPKLPATIGNGKLSVVTAGGKAECDFYNYARAFGDGESTSMYFSWGASPYDVDGTVDGHPTLSCGKYWGINSRVNEGDNIWWWGVLIFDGIDWALDIPDSTPLEQIEMRMECYVAGDATPFGFRLFDSDSYYCQGKLLTDYLTGETPKGRWFTCSIPLTEFNKSIKTYKEWRELGETNHQMGVYAQGLETGKYVCTYFDNFRLVVNPN